jgi:probable rRNA maturation factor
MNRTTTVAVTADVQIACDDPDVPATADIQTWISAAIEQSGRQPAGDVEVAVRIVDAEEIQTLNGLYRDKDKPTNVLSFPAGDIDGLPQEAAVPLGDVVVCAAVVAAEAGEQGKALADHWTHMIVHGTLHLLGFDHENDMEAAEMEALEAKILASRSVTDPYESS